MHAEVYTCTCTRIYMYMCRDNVLSFTELLVKDLNLLEKHSLITMEDGFMLQPTGS